MRALVVTAIALAACKDTPKQNAGVLAAAPPVDRDACNAALDAAKLAPLAMRPGLLLAGCHVCGSWTPILDWNLPSTQGGPKQREIESAMVGCKAFCIGDAKLKFMGTLDDARGTGSRMPWKQLGILCKDLVAGAPDGRFVDAAYFALDRIARALGDKAGNLELPLPPLTIVGNGPPLPVVDAAIVPNVADVQITVFAGAVSVGAMPRARLTAKGLVVELGADGYPGKTVTLDALAGALASFAADKTVAILAPAGMAAENLVPVIAASARPLYLAAHASDSPRGWDVPATIPVPLQPDLIKPGMTVQQLAEALVRGR